jgi:hypothetical protein
MLKHHWFPKHLLTIASLLHHRLEQLVNWLGGSSGKGECLVIFDECHRAKNLTDDSSKSTQTAIAVVRLQAALPNARVLYSSATGASEPANLAYMTRLGSAGHADMKKLITTLTKSGLGALELYCMGLKATGTYLSRTLSYTGAQFTMERIDIDAVHKVGLLGCWLLVPM